MCDKCNNRSRPKGNIPRTQILRLNKADYDDDENQLIPYLAMTHGVIQIRLS